MSDQELYETGGDRLAAAAEKLLKVDGIYVKPNDREAFLAVRDLKAELTAWDYIRNRPQ